jgi:hypothetical protein
VKRIQAALNERKRTGEGVRGIAKRFGVDPSTLCSGSAALSPTRPREAESAQMRMSALPPKAGIAECDRHVRFVPDCVAKVAKR